MKRQWLGVALAFAGVGCIGEPLDTGLFAPTVERNPCASHASWACANDDVYWFDACGEMEERKEACFGAGCVDGTCQDPCVSHASWACSNDDVYWFDACGEMEERKEACFGDGCVDGACQAGPWYGLGGSEAGFGVATGKYRSSSPSIVLDAGGNPSVAWVNQTVNGSSEVYLRRWNGDSWEELDGSATLGGVSYSGSNSGPSVALDESGAPIVAWSNYTPGQGWSVHAKLWEGTAWAELGGSATGTGLGSLTPSSWTIIAAANGAPVVAWHDFRVAKTVHVERWNGTSWAGTGPGASETAIPSSWAGGPLGASIALDAASTPVVGWEQSGEIYVQQWSGAEWAELDGSASGGGVSDTYTVSSCPVVGVDSTGRPAIAWYETTEIGARVFLKRWDGASWIELDGSGSGDGIAHAPQDSLRLVFDETDQPIVGGSIAGTFCVRRWSGAEWVEVGKSASGAPISDNAYVQVAMATPRAGRLCIAWSHEKGVFVRCADLD